MTTPQNDGVPLNPPTPAPSFLLHDQASQLVGPQQNHGHWTVVTFLYTHCPDVCPLIATQLGAAQRQNTDLRVIAVSVDPKGDTHAAVKHFLAAHRLGPQIPLRHRHRVGARPRLDEVPRRLEARAERHRHPQHLRDPHRPAGSRARLLRLAA